MTFPVDDVWHRLFGQDVTLWSPTHVLMVGGGSLATLGRLDAARRGSPRARARIPTRGARRVPCACARSSRPAASSSASRRCSSSSATASRSSSSSFTRSSSCSPPASRWWLRACGWAGAARCSRPSRTSSRWRSSRRSSAPASATRRCTSRSTSPRRRWSSSSRCASRASARWPLGALVGRGDRHGRPRGRVGLVARLDADPVADLDAGRDDRARLTGGDSPADCSAA